MGGADSWFKAEGLAEGFVYQGEIPYYESFRADDYSTYSAAIEWQYNLPKNGAKYEKNV